LPLLLFSGVRSFQGKDDRRILPKEYSLAPQDDLRQFHLGTVLATPEYVATLSYDDEEQDAWNYLFTALIRNSTLGVLRGAAGPLQAILLAFLDAGIPGYQPVPAQSGL
jgi:hypothetical protein